MIKATNEMIPGGYEEEIMLYTLVDKKPKRTEYCAWCKKPTTYHINERGYELTRNGITFRHYGLKAYCDKCEGRMLIPWIVHENMLRRREAYENASAEAEKSDGDER